MPFDMDERDVVGSTRKHVLRWNGLSPDGTLDPVPNRWTTFAALPSWAVAVIAAAEVATVTGLIVCSIVLLVRAHP